MSFDRAENEHSESERLGMKVIQIQTDAKTIRMTPVSGESNKDIYVLKVSFPKEDYGKIIEIKRNSLKKGEGFLFRTRKEDGSVSAWTNSSPLKSFGHWEASSKKISFDDLKEGMKWNLSKGMPENPDTTNNPEDYYNEDKYLEDVGQSYHFTRDGIQYAKDNPQDAKCEFSFLTRDGNGVQTNLGWKVHLNATPEHCKFISDYLKSNGYAHKFLGGGVPTDGKVFTVYFGAKSMMDKWVSVLARDFKEYLYYPGAKEEVEVARGIVARFTGDPWERTTGFGEFYPYGDYGITYLRYMPGEDKLFSPNDESVERINKLARSSFDRLAELYGSYFTG